MRPLVPGGLRARVLLLVLLIAIPLVAVTIGADLRHRRTAIVQFREAALRGTDAIVAEQDRAVDATRHLLDAITRLSGTESASCATILPSLLGLQPFVTGLGIANADGSAVCIAGDPPPIPRDDTGWLHRAIAEQTFVVGDSQGVTPRQRVMTAALPFETSDGERRVAFGAMSLTSFEQFADTAGVPSGSLFTVLDHDLRIAYRSVDPGRWVGVVDETHPVARLIRSSIKSGAVDAPGMDGIDRLLVFRSWGGTGPSEKYVVVGFPREAALTPFDRTLVLELLALAAVVLTAALVGYRAERVFVLTPLQEMKSAARCVAAGDLSVRVARNHVAELDDLAEAFNAMSTALADQRHHGERATADLLDMRRQLEQIVDAMPFFVVVSDPTGTQVVMNKGARALLGEQTALPPVPLSHWLKIYPAGQQQPLSHEECPLHKALLGQTAYLADAWVDIPGFPPRVEMWAVPIFDANGAVVRAVLILNDIAKRRTLEDQLQHAVKLEAVGRLAGGIAHEFNNLLTVILGYCDVLIDEAHDHHVSDIELRAIKTAADRARILTYQLLAFSRKQVLQPKETDVNQLIRAVTPALSPILGDDVVLELHLTDRECRVKVDHGQFDHIVLNLAVNAREAMPYGGSLRIATSVVRIEPSAATPDVTVGEYVQIAFTDTGKGMTEETRARAFEPFFTTKTDGKRSGLGLSTVYGIVRQSLGGIALDSVPGRGTTVRIYLPTVSVVAPVS